MRAGSCEPDPGRLDSRRADPRARTQQARYCLDPVRTRLSRSPSRPLASMVVKDESGKAAGALELEPQITFYVRAV